jgi:periplasmic copper chaperone A
MNRSILAVAVLALTAGGLAGCGQDQAPADAGPQAPAGITASNGRLMLPAVAGNPGAVYFDLQNSGSDNRVIRAVSVEGAGRTEMHQMAMWNGEMTMQEMFQIRVPPNQTVNLEPGGLHVMAFDLGDDVTAGSTAEVTVTFVGGDRVSFPAEVRAAGDER